MIGNDYFDDRNFCAIVPKDGDTSIIDTAVYRLFPNPANESAIYYYKVKGKNCSGISVNNVLGEKMAKFVLSSDEGYLTIDTHDFPAGVYYLQLENSLQLLNVSVLIKVK